MLPHDFLCSHVGFRIVASHEQLLTKMKENTHMVLSVGDKAMFSVPGAMAGASSGVDMPQVESFDDPHVVKGVPFICSLTSKIEIPKRFSVNTRIEFATPFADRVQKMFHDRGPGAEWILIAFYLVGDACRSVL